MHACMAFFNSWLQCRGPGQKRFETCVTQPPNWCSSKSSGRAGGGVHLLRAPHHRSPSCIAPASRSQRGLGNIKYRDGILGAVPEFETHTSIDQKSLMILYIMLIGILVFFWVPKSRSIFLSLFNSILWRFGRVVLWPRLKERARFIQNEATYYLSSEMAGPSWHIYNFWHSSS